MTRKHWMLILLAVALAALSLYLNKDWFTRDGIQVFHRSRPELGRRRTSASALVNPILFGLNRKFRLTSLKVVRLSEYQTNQHAYPVWHLISESNSVPTKEFNYGASIKGMHPAVGSAAPEELEPGVPYRLFIEAGDLKAEHDFEPVPRTP